MFGQQMDEWTDVPSLHPCVLNGKQAPRLCVFSSSEMSVLVHMTISSPTHLLWRFVEMRWQRTVMCEVQRGGSIEGRGCILPCNVNTSHITVMVPSWWAVGVPCETEHLWRSDQCFPRKPGHPQLWAACSVPAGNHSEALRLQCFDYVNGLLVF